MMNKADNIRQWLLRSVAGLSKQKDKLHIFVDDGQIIQRRSTPQKSTLSYEMRYELTIIIEDYGNASHNIIVPILAWLSENQPELVDQSEKNIIFNQDIKDNQRSDFEIKLMLYDDYIVRQNDDGGWSITLAERQASFDRFEGIGSVNLLKIYMDNPPDRILAAQSENDPENSV